VDAWILESGESSSFESVNQRWWAAALRSPIVARRTPCLTGIANSHHGDRDLVGGETATELLGDDYALEGPGEGMGRAVVKATGVFVNLAVALGPDAPLVPERPTDSRRATPWMT
jgi:hypothetical protein